MRQEYVHYHTRYLVRLIMSKFEVMQSDNFNIDTDKLSNYMNTSKYYNLKMSPYFLAFYRVPHFIMTLVKL